MTEARSNEAATNAPDTTQRTESAERLARPLIKLAKASGLATSFIDQDRKSVV